MIFHTSERLKSLWAKTSRCIKENHPFSFSSPSHTEEMTKCSVESPQRTWRGGGPGLSPKTLSEETRSAHLLLLVPRRLCVPLLISLDTSVMHANPLLAAQAQWAWGPAAKSISPREV